MIEAVFKKELMPADHILQKCGFDFYHRTVLANSDDILGEWQVLDIEKYKFKPIFDIAYKSTGVWEDCPFPQRPLLLQRVNKVHIKEEDAFLCMGEELFKAWGLVQITEIRKITDNSYIQITCFTVLPDSQLNYLE